MNVVFLTYHDFTSNSAVHVFNLANELVDSGVDCAVLVPDNPASVATIGTHRFQALDHRQARAQGLRFPDGRPPTLVHAWTPREVVRVAADGLRAQYGCPAIVHLEDNEELITADALGLTLAELAAAPDAELDASVSSKLAHPRRMRSFLASAAGITVIVDRLLEFCPAEVPAEVIWPAFERELFDDRPAEPELRRRLGIGEHESVIVYAGNAHRSNAAEMRSLYLAVAAVNRAGRPLRLVRLGRDYVELFDRELRAAVAEHVVHVPLQPRSAVPGYLRLADVFVQPGRADDFNDYRLPSKLPEFLATGRPVVLPAANLGRVLRDGEECILLERGDALEIAAALERLLDDAGLRARLGAAGRAFAERSFSWRRSAERLLGFYERVLGSRPAPVARTAAADAPAAAGLPPRLGYATVRDYCDSVDRMPLLASASSDLKDVQRPWVLKAIVARLKPGARLLEIGAGEPLVADELARCGYRVTAIDPYDGRDRGPSAFEAFQAAYPRVELIRGSFPSDLDPEARFDCVYSISVLEHLPDASVEGACASMRRLTHGGGYTIHAIDHVVAGNGAARHLDHLRRITASLGVPEPELDDLLAELTQDPETYYLSAESHNRWRAGAPYETFPMRRCVSIQLCLPIGAAP